MGLKEDVIALADELEEFEDGDCEECSLYGQPECKGHLSCMEIMARYAARKMREAVERDGEGATTVSVYDLLSEEDRKAIEWVREHGGLEAVEKRLMPPGAEWPKYTDGELVRIGGCWGEDGCDTSITYIERVIFAEDGVYLDNEYNEAFYRHGERVKHPAPKVLDADGVEIRKGEIVYDIDTGSEFTVWDICGETVYVRWGYDFEERIGTSSAKDLTHSAPVLAADGKPLREGETVWGVDIGHEYVVVEPSYGDTVVVRLAKYDDAEGEQYAPDKLTHERPVLDADGEPLEVGQTVWDTNGDELVIGAFEDGGHTVTCRYADVGDAIPVHGMWSPSDLTHQRPVLDADGVPIHVGETVYKLEDSRPYMVKQIDGDHVYINAGGKAFDIWTFPGKLTHEQPDSWEKWREDSELSPIDYCVMIGYPPSEEESAELIKNRDLVRRARKLAERDE